MTLGGQNTAVPHAAHKISYDASPNKFTNQFFVGTFACKPPSSEHPQCTSDRPNARDRRTNPPHFKEYRVFQARQKPKSIDSKIYAVTKVFISQNAGTN